MGGMQGASPNALGREPRLERSHRFRSTGDYTHRWGVDGGQEKVRPETRTEIGLRERDRQHGTFRQFLHQYSPLCNET